TLISLEKLEGIVNLIPEQEQILAVVRKSEFAPKIKYNEGENFSRLISHPSSIIKSSEFEKFLTDENISDLTDKNLAGLIIKKEDPANVIGPILKYRIFQYLGKTSDEREKDYKPEDMLELIQEAERNYSQDIDGLTVGTRTGKELKISLRKTI
ncbi:14699_t:CDS:2, partial [Funneliformis geosporum]